MISWFLRRFRRTGEPPDWAKDYISAAYNRYNLQDWHLHVIWTNFVDGSFGKNTLDGQAQTDFDYLNACIELKNTLKPDDNARLVITHELVHVLQAPQIRAADDMIAQLPFYLRSGARKRWTTANEQTVERLARILVRVPERDIIRHEVRATTDDTLDSGSVEAEPAAAA